MSRKGGALPAPDTEQLNSSILYRPGADIFDAPRVSPQAWLPGDVAGGRGIGGSERYHAFVRALEAHGMEILWFEDLLDDAIAQARAAGTLGAWLHAHVPAAQQAHMPGASELTGADIIQALGTSFARADGLFGRTGWNLRPLIGSMTSPIVWPTTAPVQWMDHGRDLVAMTPRGAILCNLQDHERAIESALARLLFDHARALQAYPVAFDAAQEGVFLTGGDVIVADADTLLLGTGNLTESRAAPMLAQKLHMDVVEVRMPGRALYTRDHIYDAWTGIPMQRLCLDTIFGLVDRDKILAPPCFLEARHAGLDPLTRILEGLGAEPGVDQARMRQVLHELGNVGWVTRYQAGSGEVVAMERSQKLVDHMRDQGYALVPVGGEQGTLGEMVYVMERVLRELGSLAAHVTATAPGKVIARGQNALTNAALRAAGVEVITV